MSKSSLKRTLACSASAIVVAAMPQVAFAQDQESSNDAAEDENVIIVNAKREVAAVDLPIAVDVFSGDDVANSGVTDLNDIALISPSVNVASASAYASPFIRGVGSSTLGPNIYGSVAFYVDGIYQPNQIALNTGGGSFEDAQSVQVLKGPQGTLYGRNATGGAILIETFTPSPGQEFEGFLQAEIAEFDTRVFTGRASVGLGENAAASLNFSVHDADGFVENRGFGNDFDDQDGFRIGGKLVLEPTDRLSFVLSGSYFEDEESFVSGQQIGQNDTFAALPGLNNAQSLWAGTIFQFVQGGVFAQGGSQADADAAVAAVFPTVLGLASGIQFFDEFGVSADNNGPSGFENGVHPQASPLPSKGRYASTNVSLKAQFNFDTFDIVSLTGYIESLERNVIDVFRADPTTLPDVTVLGFPAVFNQGNIGFSQPVDNDAFSQEVYAVSTAGDIDWIVGVYYFEQTSTHQISSDVFGTSTIIADNEITTESISAFAELTFPLTDTLSVTGGLRYTDEQSELVDEIGPGAPFPNFGTLSRSDDQLTYNAKLTYDSGGFLAYAGVTTGFKSGALNPTAPFAGQVAPEELTSYEIGFKADLDSGIQLTGAAFIYDYQNIQLSITSTVNGGVGFLVDSVEADVFGLEFSANAPLTDDLSIFANATFLDHEYTTDAVIQGTGEIQAIAGNKLAQTPDFASSFGLNYNRLLNSGAEFNARLSGNYNSGFFGDQLNINGSGGNDDDGYVVVNASIEYVLPSGNLAIGAFVNNVFDEEYFIGTLNVGGGASQLAAPGRPQQFGGRVRFNF